MPYCPHTTVAAVLKPKLKRHVIKNESEIILLSWRQQHRLSTQSCQKRLAGLVLFTFVLVAKGFDNITMIVIFLVIPFPIIIINIFFFIIFKKKLYL